MSYPSVYYVEKTTGTFGDALLAYGGAKFLLDVVPQEGTGAYNLLLADRGSAYLIQIEGTDGIPQEWIPDGPPPLIRFLGTEKEMPGCPPHIRTFAVDYEAEKKQRDDYWQWRNDLSDEDKRRVDELANEHNVVEPHSELPLWILINTQKAIKSYNKLVVTWHEHQTCYSQLAHLILTTFSQFPNPIDDALTEWQALASKFNIEGDTEETATQLGNPGLGKGGNRSKANKLVERNINAFWLLEYLRYVGLFVAGVSIQVQGAKDRKTYVPIPQQMQWSTAVPVLLEYRRAMWNSTAVKSDILAVLRYLDVYLRGWLDVQENPDAPPWASPQPDDHVSGIAAVFYKDMGSAHAMMDMSLLALPRWIRDLQSPDDALVYLNVIKEHRNIISNLEESHGDEFTMLRKYRRFLTSSDLRDFLDFCASLGPLAMRLWSHTSNRERSRANLFNASTIEGMVDMSEDRQYSEIFQNEGFQRMAAAIRQATYLPQYFKSKGQQGEYQPEYGLGQKLIQSATSKESFLEELGQFVHSYQAETLRKMEHPRNKANKGKPQRVTLSAEDVADIAWLVDEYGGAGPVAAMLVAAGYSWAERRSERQEVPDPE